MAFYASDWDIDALQLSHINPKSCKSQTMKISWWIMNWMNTCTRADGLFLYIKTGKTEIMYMWGRNGHTAVQTTFLMYIVTGPSLRRSASFKWYKDSYWKQLH